MKKITIGKGKVVKVDDGDFKYLSQFAWYPTGKSGHPARKQPLKNYSVFLHY